MTTSNQIRLAVLKGGREVLKRRRPKASFNLDRALGADGYMFDDWGKARSLSEEIVDAAEDILAVPDEIIQLPMSYPPSKILDGTLGALLTDLTGRIDSILKPASAAANKP